MLKKKMKITLVGVLLVLAGSVYGENRKFDYFFYEGLKLKAAEQYDAAYDLFNHCLAIDSTASALLYELSSFYITKRPGKCYK